MTWLEIVFIVGGTLALRPFIEDNFTYFIVCGLYGATLGVISGLLKSRDN